jgi:hypothetical protein
MLQVYLDVRYICNDFQVFSCIFASVSDTFFKCFICLLLHVASGTHLNISKIDRVLHIECAWEVEGDASDPYAWFDGAGPLLWRSLSMRTSSDASTPFILIEMQLLL